MATSSPSSGVVVWGTNWISSTSKSISPKASSSACLVLAYSVWGAKTVICPSSFSMSVTSTSASISASSTASSSLPWKARMAQWSNMWLTLPGVPSLHLVLLKQVRTSPKVRLGLSVRQSTMTMQLPGPKPS